MLELFITKREGETQPTAAILGGSSTFFLTISFVAYRPPLTNLRRIGIFLVHFSMLEKAVNFSLSICMQVQRKVSDTQKCILMSLGAHSQLLILKKGTHSIERFGSYKL